MSAIDSTPHFYNRQRRHSRLGNVPPALFAENFSKQPQAA
ncbi:Mobile element protein [Janthinobacterium sp. CG23_2]|nr:Mobile element protein [Janthinobacterium sp. CG23_2]CUU26851.1 Mobile element protein [Janthinobacterium sp. CG23_2]